MKKVRKIIIVLRLSGTSGRDILSGIFLYTRQNPHWHTRIFQMPTELTPDVLSALMEEGCDGVIASEYGTDDTARMLRDSSLPISFIGDPGPILSQRKRNLTYIRNDDERIGRLGARYLDSLGNHRAYAFLPTLSDQYWSRLRHRGFEDELKRRGRTCVCFSSPGSVEDLAALKDWLLELPKPVALMAAWDMRATQAIHMCEEAKIRIPQQVSILGVDNDELLDEATNPPLSSIQPDHERLGFVAARELERLINGRPGKTGVAYLAPPLRLVERESAIATAPAAHLIIRAMDYIRKNATRGIRPNDVAAYLGVSRRLVDLRFHQFSGETLNAAITTRKLDAVRKLLATTDRSIRNISLNCGYADLAYLKTLFKRRFGMTMRAYRSLSR